MSEADETDRALARLERAVDEAYSRYARAAEAERIDGMAAALREALSSEPATSHDTLLRLMADRYQSAPTRSATGGALDEIRHLRAELASLRQSAIAEPVRQPAADAALLRGLLGRDADRLPAGAPADAAQMVAVIEQLTKLALDLAKAFLTDGDKQHDDTGRHVDRFRTTLLGELSGTLPTGSFGALLDEIRRTVAAPLEAFPGACDAGARQILRELDPLVLDDEATESGVRVMGYRPFRLREIWDKFQQRHQELSASEDLYGTYFDAPLRKSLRRRATTRKGHD